MPLIRRAMRIADGKPEIGRGATLLGVRIGLGPADDIPEENGYVRPGTGGMSVSPSVDKLPPHRLPRRLRSKFPEATGSNQLYCWFMGEGKFLAGSLTEQLTLRPDPQLPEDHGFVEPATRMSLADYEAALAATQAQWEKWQED